MVAFPFRRSSPWCHPSLSANEHAGLGHVWKIKSWKRGHRACNLKNNTLQDTSCDMKSIVFNLNVVYTSKIVSLNCWQTIESAYSSLTLSRCLQIWNCKVNLLYVCFLFFLNNFSLVTFWLHVVTRENNSLVILFVVCLCRREMSS